MPAPVARAQQEFDKRLADVLDGMANRMSGKTSDRHNGFRIPVEDLEKNNSDLRFGKVARGAYGTAWWISLVVPENRKSDDFAR